MGSIKRHRRVNSDSESIQWRPKPGNSDSMSYGYIPYIETPLDFSFRLNYKEPEGFYTYYDVKDFKRTFKA